MQCLHVTQYVASLSLSTASHHYVTQYKMTVCHFQAVFTCDAVRSVTQPLYSISSLLICYVFVLFILLFAIFISCLLESC